MAACHVSTVPADLIVMCELQGVVFINGFNVGRYWPVAGPQVTLYVPAGRLRAAPQSNQIVLLELESSPSSRDPVNADTVEFVSKPVLNGRCFQTSQQVVAGDHVLLLPNELPTSSRNKNL